MRRGKRFLKLALIFFPAPCLRHALNELFPNWKELGAPLNTPVKRDDIYLLKDKDKSSRFQLSCQTMHNEGNYIPW